MVDVELGRVGRKAAHIIRVHEPDLDFVRLARFLRSRGAGLRSHEPRSNGKHDANGRKR